MQLVEATNSDTTDLICDETTVLTIHCPLISLNLARTDAAPTQKLISSSPLFSAQCMGWRALFKSIHYHARPGAKPSCHRQPDFLVPDSGLSGIRSVLFADSLRWVMPAAQRDISVFLCGVTNQTGNKATAVDIAHTEAETDR